VLGRTGAGKSSLVSNLFRMVYNESCRGAIYIDGIDVRAVPLDHLRSRMSIIPQVRPHYSKYNLSLFFSVLLLSLFASECYCVA
jgi:ABC-type multidrug transport system fused ATPase/permease subunit